MEETSESDMERDGKRRWPMDSCGVQAQVREICGMRTTTRVEGSLHKANSPEESSELLQKVEPPQSRPALSSGDALEGPPRSIKQVLDPHRRRLLSVCPSRDCNDGAGSSRRPAEGDRRVRHRITTNRRAGRPCAIGVHQRPPTRGSDGGDR